jgi:hypothetical protein
MPKNLVPYEERASVRPGERHLYWSDEEDLARAYLGALEAVQIGYGRFDAVMEIIDQTFRHHSEGVTRSNRGETTQLRPYPAGPRTQNRSEFSGARDTDQWYHRSVQPTVSTRRSQSSLPD